MLDRTAEYIHNARELAEAARLAYGGDHATKFTAVTRLGDLGFVGTSGGNTVVAFRGVEDLRGWLKSLSYVQTPGYGGAVHRGFAAALERVWEPLAQAVGDASERTLWITGHSMGGAIATLAAQRLFAGGVAPFETFTFGAPRVFDPVAAGAFAPRLRRFVNALDIVPSLPTSGPRHRFAHAGEQVLLLAGGGVAFGRRRWLLAARRLARAGLRGLLRRAGQRALDAHKLDRYIANLQATIDLSLPY